MRFLLTAIFNINLLQNEQQMLQIDAISNTIFTITSFRNFLYFLFYTLRFTSGCWKPKKKVQPKSIQIPIRIHFNSYRCWLVLCFPLFSLFHFMFLKRVRWTVLDLLLQKSLLSSVVQMHWIGQLWLVDWLYEMTDRRKEKAILIFH